MVVRADPRGRLRLGRTAATEDFEVELGPHRRRRAAAVLRAPATRRSASVLPVVHLDLWKVVVDIFRIRAGVSLRSWARTSPEPGLGGAGARRHHDPREAGRHVHRGRGGQGEDGGRQAVRGGAHRCRVGPRQAVRQPRDAAAARSSTCRASRSRCTRWASPTSTAPPTSRSRAASARRPPRSKARLVHAAARQARRQPGRPGLRSSVGSAPSSRSRTS